MPDVGRVLGGRYRLLELLGEGGMATIYRAHDSQLDRDVAVKVLLPQYGRDASFIARFRQEAQAAASLSHPNVVAVYDYGTDEAGPFIVMELIDGQNLADLLRERGPIPPVVAARVGIQIADALAAAHDRGIVHRDVKPSNVLVTDDGRVRVVDFGIARAFSESQLTLPGTTLGSVHYFSPEQARGEPVTAASDIYSLGLVLYEMLTGRRPWTGDTAGAVALARLSGRVPHPSEVRPDVPPALDAIVARALAFEPGKRYASARELAEALGAVVQEVVGPAALHGALGLTDAGMDRPEDAAAGAAAQGSRAAARPPGRGAVGPGAELSAAGSGVPGGQASGAAGAASGGAPRSPGVPPPGQPTQGTGARGAPAEAWRAQRPGTGAPTSAGRDRQARRSARPTVPPVAPARRQTEPDQDGDGEEPSGLGIWAWAAGILGIVVLLLAGATIALFLSRGLGSGASPSPALVSVPDLVGSTLQAAQQKGSQLGLDVVIGQTQQSTSQPENTVTAQDQKPGTMVPAGSTIKVTITTGQPLVPVPDLTHQTIANAVVLLVKAGLTPGTQTQAYDPVVPSGQILSQDIAAGVQVPAGTAVGFVVSEGPAPSPSPSPTPVSSAAPSGSAPASSAPPATPTPVAPTPVPPPPTPPPPTPVPPEPTPTPPASP